MPKFWITMHPSIEGRKTKVVQRASGKNKKEARRNAKENLYEEYGSDLW
jgi:hypothetical protein